MNHGSLYKEQSENVDIVDNGCPYKASNLKLERIPNTEEESRNSLEASKSSTHHQRLQLIIQITGQCTYQVLPHFPHSLPGSTLGILKKFVLFPVNVCFHLVRCTTKYSVTVETVETASDIETPLPWKFLVSGKGRPHVDGKRDELPKVDREESDQRAPHPWLTSRSSFLAMSMPSYSFLALSHRFFALHVYIVYLQFWVSSGQI